MSGETVGQMSLDSITPDANPPIKAAWRMRPACGRCGVWLTKGWTDEQGNFQKFNESACARCGQVNRLD